MFGRAIITGLARLDGAPVAVMASDPVLLRRLLDRRRLPQDHPLCRSGRDLPSADRLSLDCPGFLIGLEAEKAATIRQGVRAMAAINQTTVPWCTFIMRNVSASPAPRTSRPAGCRSAMPGSRAMGLAAAGRRHRGGLPRRDRRRARPRRQDRRDRRAAEQAALAVPHRRDLLGRGDHRPARHPPLVCDFARLSDKLLAPGPSAFPIRP